MKKLRIILSVIIALAVVSAMFACGGKKDDKPESGGSPAESGSSISPLESDSSEPAEDVVVFSLNQEYIEIYIKPEGSESGFISEFRAEVTELSINGEEVTDPVLEWSSGDESIATVENGLIKPVKAGETNISVTYRPEGKDPVSAEVYVFVYVEVSYRVKIFKRPWTEEGNADEVLENTEVYYDRLDSDTLAGKEIKIEDYVPEKGYGVDNEASVLSGTLTPGGETVLEIHLVQREPVPEPVAAGIREMSLNDIELLSPDSGTATLKPDKGFLVYKAAQSGGGDGRKFRIAGNGNLAPESHVAFLVKFRTKNENGLSLRSCKHKEWSEFEFYNDKHELVDYDMRDTDIWYVAVSPDDGYNEASEDYHNVFFFCDWAKPEVLIAGIYEVSPEAYIDAFPKEPKLTAPEALSLENGTTTDIGAKIEFAKEDSPAIVYEVMDGSSVVTVDANGSVTAKETGSCDIKISAEGIGETICHVTVTFAPPRLDGEGVVEISVDSLRPMAFKAGTKFEKTTEGYMRYSGTSLSEAENKFYLNGNGGFDSDSYLVFLIMYTENQEVGPSYTANEGLWLGMFPYGKEGWAYFSTFDAEGYDYTIYKDQFDKGDVMLGEGVDTHYGFGSINRPNEGYETKPNTWYYQVSPYKNLNGAISPYENSYFMSIAPFDYLIARIYTVSEEAYQRLFKPNVRPKQGPALEIDARALSLKEGESVNLNAVLKNTEGEITYEAENDCVTVDADGKITAVKEGECKVIIKGAGLKRECAVKVLPDEKPEEGGEEPGEGGGEPETPAE